MTVSMQNIGNTLFQGMGGLKSTQDKMERQQKCASQVDFFEKQKENLKSMQCDSIEDIARKLEMFHSYEDQIAAAKKEFNNSQMSHVLDEAREIGEKIAEAAKETEPKTPEERREEMVKEAAGTEEESKGLLEEVMEEIDQMLEETTEEMREETQKDLEETAQEMPLESAESPAQALAEDPQAFMLEKMQEKKQEQKQEMEETIEQHKQLAQQERQMQAAIFTTVDVDAMKYQHIDYRL